MKIFKNLFILGLVILLITVLLLPGKATALPVFQDGTIIIDEVSVLNRPSKDSPVMTKLDIGTRIGVFCEERPGWYRIIYGNYRGYIKSDAVFLSGKNQVSGNCLVDNQGVYTVPSNAADANGTINAGYPLSIIDMIGDWYEIAAEDAAGNSIQGYVPKSNIMINQNDYANEIVLTVGMSGETVKNMQEALRARGFYGYSASGYFDDSFDENGNAGKGTNTYKSLRYFQQKAGLDVTGIADKATLDKLYSDEDIHSYAQDKGVRGSVMVYRWWETVNYEFDRGDVATVMDVRTRKVFEIQRYSGTSHADVETLTKEDTAILKGIYSGVWSWDRRPVWVTVGGTTYAASMNGMPHAPGNSGIDDNGMNGQICIHFKDSYGHSSNSEDPAHAQNVKDAYFSSMK